MLKHENHNIEIINKNLWAVRFSMIPLIPQINITAQPGTDLAKESFGLTPEGIMVLNKDVKIYPLFKTACSSVMKMNNRQIEKELNRFSIGILKKTSVQSTVYHASLVLERERRKIAKGGVT